MNGELPDVQAGFRKDSGTRDQIVNIRWIVEKAREFQKNIYFCFIDDAKVFDGVVPGAGERHSTRDKGYEEGGSAYAKAGSSLRSPPGYSRASTPKKPESAYFIALCSHL